MFEKEFEFFRNRAAVFKERVRETIYPEYYPLDCRFAVSAEPVSFADWLNLDYRSISPGEKWGESWDSAWFHITGTVPENCAGREIALLFNAGGEALIFDSDGVPLHGLTGNSHFADKYTKERFLLKGKNAGDKIDIWIEAAANDLLGLVFGPVFGQTIISKEHPQGQFIGLLDRCTLAVFDREAWHLHLDLEVLTSLIDGLPEQDFRRGRWCKVLSKAADVYNENPANTAAAREVLKEIFDIAPSGAMMTVHGGHAHIDTAWLWPVRETIRKCARTYSSQLALMEEYPEYVFGASAAQHYAFTKKHYPELYAKIKEAVKSGRWEIQGGMWVEADSNIISGESMVRQFVHGKNFFMDEFGIEEKNLWIPDVFGYSAALPQVIRDKELYKCRKINEKPFKTFEQYCANVFIMSRTHAYRMIAYHYVRDVIGESAEKKIPERLTRPLASIKDEKTVEDLWKKAKERSQTAIPESKILCDVVAEYKQEQKEQLIADKESECADGKFYSACLHRKLTIPTSSEATDSIIKEAEAHV